MRLFGFRLLALACPLLAAAPLVACGAPKEEASAPGATSDDELIGGRVAEAGELDSTMQVEGNCTVSKVGPRHILTAAHCVHPRFTPGMNIRVTNAKRVGTFADPGAEDPYRDYTLEKVEVEQEWKTKCVGSACNSIRQTELMADVALLVTTEDIAGIPEAAIDLSPMQVGDPVTITGYGCEDEVGGSWSYSGSRLRIAETQVEPFDIVIHDGSFIQPRDRETGLFAMLDSVYLATPGPAWVRSEEGADGGAPVEAGTADGGSATDIDAGSDGGGAASSSHAGLCPGDSGGPLYRRGVGDRLIVVGVNANYTFSGGREYTEGDIRYRIGGAPTSNWQTRLDAVNGLKIGAWLRELGANTVCTGTGC